MRQSELDIVKIWEKAANDINGNFTMPLQKINGGSTAGGMYLFRIDTKINDITIQVHTGIYEFPLLNNEYKGCSVTITAKKEKREKIELSIWRKDFIDKLFNKSRPVTGYIEFDKVIGLKSTRNIERKFSNIFNNAELRSELINDKFRSYNLRTEDGQLVFERKSGLSMQNTQMIVEEYNYFKLFLDGFINANIF